MDYTWSTDSVALMGNVMLATFVFGVTLGGMLLPKYGAKVSCLVGTAMFGVFFIISSFVFSPVLMYVTYGGICGLGVGVLYVVCQFAASAWFPDKRGMVMGLFLAIFGLSVTIFATPLSMMLQGMGVKRTMLVVGIVITVICFIGSMFMKMPPAGWKPAGMEQAAKVSPADASDAVTLSEAIRTRDFWLITAAYSLLVWPYAFISSYFSIFVTEYKMLPAAAAVTAISLTGLGSASGRFFGGVVVDKLGCKVTYAIMCGCSVIACLLLISAKGAGMIGLLFFILCFGYGGRTPVYGVIFNKQFGTKYASSIYGWGTLGTAIFLVVAPLVTASLRNHSGGSFTGTLLVAIVVTCIGCACMMLVPAKTPMERKQQ